MAKRAEYLGPERRRPLVLDAALQIFAEGGFADASMAAIAERAGVSKAVLYDCFPGGKQGIYSALVDRCEELFVAELLAITGRTNRMPLREALDVWLTAFLDFAAANPEVFRVIFGEAGTSDVDITRKTEQAKQAIVDKMGERTYQIMREAGVPITRLAGIYNRAMVAAAEEMVRWLLSEPDLPRAKIVRALVTWWMDGFERIIPGDAHRRPLPDQS